MSLSICRKTTVLELIVLQPERRNDAHITSAEKASSVPGRMQTVVVESSGAANPHVPVLKLWVVSLSPTFAGRDLTLCRLKSHMAEELLSCERRTNPDPLAKNGAISQHARQAKDTCTLAERLRRKADRIDPARVRRPYGCWGEAHLRRILTKYAAYYNELRTHRSLNKNAPIHRAIQYAGDIVSAPVLGGLHYHYCRI